MTIKESRNIYMVGIKGYGMASLAVVLAAMGKHVQGSDVDERFPTDELLDSSNIMRHVGFDARNIPADTDVVITTGAHGGLKNPEVLAAQEKGVRVLTHGQALGETMDLFATRIGVCGTHGKTTTSAMCAYVMTKLGCKIGYQIGTASFSGMNGGGYSGDDYFVVESDEYVSSPGIDNTPRFHYQHPQYAICMNIDLDHVDVYKDLDAVKASFKTFFEIIKDQNGTLVYCRDDMNAFEVASSVHGLNTLSYGFSEESDIVVSLAEKSYSITFPDGESLTGTLTVPGRHNVLNATGVLVLVKILKLDVTKATEVLTEFQGSKLRFEVLLENNDYALVNDYAHHPVEIRVTIDAARSRYPGRRIIAVFHPHTLSRTKQFKDEFVQELKKADKAYFFDIYASARDDDDKSLTSQMIVDEAGLDNLEYLPEAGAAEMLLDEIQKGDVILMIGAGSKFGVHEKLCSALKEK